MRTKLTSLRDSRTCHAAFVACAHDLARLALAEAAELIPTCEVEVTTPIRVQYPGVTFESESVCAVSVLRGGDAIATVARDMFACPVGHILVQRDANASANHIFTKLPTRMNSAGIVLLCDPMVATGNTAIKAIEQLIVVGGIATRHIVLVTLISCQRGIDAITARYPSVHIVTCAIDPVLNARSYIEPGLGDFGDRYCRTFPIPDGAGFFCGLE